MKLGSTAMGLLLTLSVIALLFLLLVIKAAYTVIENPSFPPVAATPTELTPTTQPATSIQGWTGCTTPNECTITKGICGPAAVNKQYFQDFEAYVAERSKIADCAPSKTIPTEVTCQKNQCILLTE